MFFNSLNNYNLYDAKRIYTRKLLSYESIKASKMFLTIHILFYIFEKENYLLYFFITLPGETYFQT